MMSEWIWTAGGLVGGLVAIAVSIWFGLQSFKGGVTEKLQKMSEDLSALRTKLDSVWDVIPKGSPNWSGTVVRELPRLGKVEISASPGDNQTQYFIKIQHDVINADLLDLLTKQTGFEEYEKRLFDGKVAQFDQVSRNAIVIRIPATKPSITTEFVTKFLEWMDSEYIAKREQALAEYEAPILPQRQD